MAPEIESHFRAQIIELIHCEEEVARLKPAPAGRSVRWLAAEQIAHRAVVPSDARLAGGRPPRLSDDINLDVLKVEHLARVPTVEPIGEPEHVGAIIAERDDRQNDLSPVCSTGQAAGRF
jgi:hypothetical protein